MFKGILSNNLISIKNNSHRKLCLRQICAENYEEIAGYFEEISVQIWHEQDFFGEFDCFWHRFHQIPLKYPDIPS